MLDLICALSTQWKPCYEQITTVLYPWMCWLPGTIQMHLLFQQYWARTREKKGEKWTVKSCLKSGCIPCDLTCSNRMKERERDRKRETGEGERESNTPIKLSLLSVQIGPIISMTTVVMVTWKYINVKPWQRSPIELSSTCAHYRRR